MALHPHFMGALAAEAHVMRTDERSLCPGIAINTLAPVAVERPGLAAGDPRDRAVVRQPVRGVASQRDQAVAYRPDPEVGSRQGPAAECPLALVVGCQPDRAAVSRRDPAVGCRPDPVEECPPARYPT